jgi:TatD DNase family protein
MHYIDSHAHLSGETLFDQSDNILERAKGAGIDAIVNICTDSDSLEKGFILSKKYPWIYNTASTTPHDVEKEGEQFFPMVEKNAKMGELVAIGETGLDYHYQHSPRHIQKYFFIKYLHLALETKLPVVIHCRDAFDDFFEILDTEYIVNNKHAPGVLHCFTGTIDDAYKVIERGWYLSLSGIVTFKKSEPLRDIAKVVPLKQLLIETDAPYLAPQSKRGELNEPSFISEIASVIASAKNISLEEVAEASKQNAKFFFKMK